MQRYNLRRFFCGMCSVEAWVVYPTSRNITPSSCAKSCQARTRAASLAANTMSLLIFHRIVNAPFWWVLASVNHLIRFFWWRWEHVFCPALMRSSWWLLWRQMWKLWGVSWPGEEQIHIKSRDMPWDISLLLGFQDARSVRMVFETAEWRGCRHSEAKEGGV